MKLDGAGWQSLEATLHENQSNKTITDTIIRHLRELNADSLLIEEDYIDRDFSEAYSAYYAKTFRRHSKLCRRILVFASDVTFLNPLNDVQSAISQLEAQAFLGQIILRPVMGAPINQVILRTPPVSPPYEAHLLVKGEYRAHVMGAELRVDGVPMTQQDSRVGACAQATIWVAARHFHTRHRGPWLSTVSITQSAILNSEHNINQVLPAGSEFLTINNMVSALRAAGQEPLVYGATGLDSATNLPTWGGTLRPEDIINRYVDSGIPVIAGLKYANQAIGHAIIVTGQIFSDTPVGNLPNNPTRAVYCAAYYANDDQIGPNIKVATTSSSKVGEAPYNIADNIIYLMIPLPNKVFLPAEVSEAISWDILEQYANLWPNLKQVQSADLGQSAAVGDSFVDEFRNKRVIARTYLTYGWKSKHRSIRNNLPNKVRNIIASLDLPRFVYVTEFSTLDLTSSKTKYERRILAHSVVDATAKHNGGNSVLLFYAPGFCLTHSHDVSGNFTQNAVVVENSEPYYPKIRGENDFSHFCTS
ncbi:hypothetical protein [Methylobacterium sp. J-092]|uniref:hypothetical protein n=1 Tax=Methylobacterium sp. J-092 TaxID=2836667 RepID=UPI001FB8E6D4|nr:hypothetical protein [Methylobacterium sp. J-092]MCJ2008208.1 hypothetical protein [Methylobacterium sp. J-092]